MLQNIAIEKPWTWYKMNATVLILVWLQNSNSDIQLPNFS